MNAAGTNITGALIGSLLGAVIGCAAWVGVGYATGYQLGIVAVGVGLAVGIGAAMGAKGRAGTAGGIVAAVVAMLSIVVARYIVIQVEITQQIEEARAEFGDEIPDSSDDAYWTAFIADQIITEREKAGETVEWDWESEEDEEEWAGSGYPTDIWMEAQGAWGQLSMSEREEFCKAGTEMLLSGDAEGYRQVASIIGMLISNLHPMALIIMGIAVSGAYKVAKNSRPANEHAMENGVDVTAEAMGSATAAAAPAPAPAMTSGFPNMPAAQPTMHSGGAPSIAKQPAKPVRPYKSAALDESQLPPQFRMKPPEDLPPIRAKRDERDAA